MLTLQSEVTVPGLTGPEITDFMLNCADDRYQAWWPGTHLEFHILARGSRADHVGDVVLMDEYVGSRRVRMVGEVIEAVPGEKIVWQLRLGRHLRVPVRLSLVLSTAEEGEALCHTITAGWSGVGRWLDPLWRLYFSKSFARTMDRHAHTEFPLLGNLLHPQAGDLKRARLEEPLQNILADFNDPLVRETAARLTKDLPDVRSKLEALFYYVRDDIQFGFPPNGDLTAASETIRLGIGQCNTKGTLFLALCKAAGIPARLHFSLIRKDIQRGLFEGLAYRLLPQHLSHAWLEVELDGSWRRLDGYINDAPFFDAAREALRRCGWGTGFSVAGADGEVSIAFAPEDERFVQMQAVVHDHGVWDDPTNYYRSSAYRNRPGALRLLMYRLLIGGINKKIAAMRSHNDDRHLVR